LVPGGKIILTTISGFRHNMTCSNVNGENTRGIMQNVNKSNVLVGEIKGIPLDEVEILYEKRVSAAATVPLAVLGAMGVLFGIYAIAVSSGGGYW